MIPIDGNILDTSNNHGNMQDTNNLPSS